jgi:hypothetical protein
MLSFYFCWELTSRLRLRRIFFTGTAASILPAGLLPIELVLAGGSLVLAGAGLTGVAGFLPLG